MRCCFSQQPSLEAFRSWPAPLACVCNQHGRELLLSAFTARQKPPSDTLGFLCVLGLERLRGRGRAAQIKPVHRRSC